MRTTRFESSPLWRGPGAFVALAAIGVAVGLLSALPVVRLAFAGLTRGGELAVAAAWSLASSRAALLATQHSLETSLASAAISLVLGGAVALVATLWDMPGRRAFSFLFLLSMMMAPQVAALAFAGLLGPASPLLLALDLAPPAGSSNPMRGAAGIIGVLGLHHAPLAFVVIRAGLARLPREVAEAAALDGASRTQTILRVVLPLTRGHVAAAALLCFASALGNFGIPAILGLSSGYLTLPTLIYRRLTSFGPSVIGDAASLSLVLVVLAGGSVLAAQRLVSRAPALSSDGRTLDGLWTPGRAARAAAVFSWFMIVLCTVLPFLSLLGSALVPSYGMPLSWRTLTADHFVEVLLRQDVTTRAFRNSLLFAGTAALLCASLALVLGYALVRRWPRLRATVETAIELPYAIPGIVLALAAILLLLRPLPLVGISLYGTGAIIVLAYAARFLPLAFKPVTASIDQLDPAVEEAAALCGAGALQRLRYVVAPAVAPGVVAGSLMVFLLAFNELTVSALLWSRGTETIGVILFSLDEAGLASTAAAVAVLSTLVIATVMLVLDRLAPRLPAGSLPWQ
ncbi:iron ABC transporter permease [uncultured Alsobacter sp.]|uniref:ABC transporter permease n=1 Tax=uncultured Alsobacter sp. TaxID=1748258 RepID=UPI0025D3C4FE|nr:iron ABC transporter permease [uncultured Alsobacter sp.]